MLMILCILFLFGCSKLEVDSFEKTIELIENNQFYINCSEEITYKEKSGNSIGYLCAIIIDDQTRLLDKNHQPLEISDFTIGDSIVISFTEPITITKTNRDFVAEKIILQ